MMITTRLTRLSSLRCQLYHNAYKNQALNIARNRSRVALQNAQSSLPLIPTCPTPTCECADMPQDLDIDSRADLYGTMAAYSDHILISTGQSDWNSKIEDERTTAPWGELIGNVRDLLGPKGTLHDPYRNVVVSASSFEATPQSGTESTLQAIHFPSFTVIDSIDHNVESLKPLLQDVILAKKSVHVQHLTQNDLPDNLRIRPIDAPTILICSHNSRDSRCGVLGPLLQNEFVTYINKRNTLRKSLLSKELTTASQDSEHIQSVAAHPRFEPQILLQERLSIHPINVGMISHIGGHKWAGNVIVYIPPNYPATPSETQATSPSQYQENQPGEIADGSVKTDGTFPTDQQQPNMNLLAGKGIWYGRVEPRHVEGIVEQTIGRGKIIRELFRGGVDENGQPMRL